MDVSILEAAYSRSQHPRPYARGAAADLCVCTMAWRFHAIDAILSPRHRRDEDDLSHALISTRPPTMCTTPLPAKSTTPIPINGSCKSFESQPSRLQDQWATTG